MLVLACDIVQCVHVSTYFLPLMLYQCDGWKMYVCDLGDGSEAECFKLSYYMSKVILCNNIIINMKYCINRRHMIKH